MQKCYICGSEITDRQIKKNNPAIPGILFRKKRIRGNANNIDSVFYKRNDSMCLRAGDANWIFWQQK